MPAVTADNNELQFTDVKKTEVKKWGDYKQKVKWKLKENAKNRGFIVQVVTFTHEVRWVDNDKVLTDQELFDQQAGWLNYSELWLVSANKDQPAGTLNQDHFCFTSFEDTYGWIKEEGVAYFFESGAKAKDLGFQVNKDCPAGEYMPSKKGTYNPRNVVKTASINHKVHVKWDKTGSAQVVSELP